MGVVLARQNSGKDHMRRPCTKNDARPQSSMGFGDFFTSSRMQTKLRLILLLKPR